MSDIVCKHGWSRRFCEPCNSAHIIASLKGPGGMGMLALEAEIARLRAQNAELVAALRAARVSIEDWASYASDYHKEKWDLAGDLAFIDAAIASIETPTASAAEAQDE